MNLILKLWSLTVNLNPEVAAFSFWIYVEDGRLALNAIGQAVSEHIHRPAICDVLCQWTPCSQSTILLQKLSHNSIQFVCAIATDNFSMGDPLEFDWRFYTRHLKASSGRQYTVVKLIQSVDDYLMSETRRKPTTWAWFFCLVFHREQTVS